MQQPRDRHAESSVGLSPGLEAMPALPRGCWVTHGSPRCYRQLGGQDAIVCFLLFLCEMFALQVFFKEPRKVLSGAI